MESDSSPTRRPPDQPGLEHCGRCRRPNMTPEALLDVIDEGLYLIAMRCRSCDRVSVGAVEDAELERLERLRRS